MEWQIQPSKDNAHTGGDDTCLAYTVAEWDNTIGDAKAFPPWDDNVKTFPARATFPVSAGLFPCTQHAKTHNATRNHVQAVWEQKIADEWIDAAVTCTIEARKTLQIRRDGEDDKRDPASRDGEDDKRDPVQRDPENDKWCGKALSAWRAFAQQEEADKKFLSNRILVEVNQR